MRRVALVAAMLMLGGCGAIPASVAVSAGVSLIGIANQDALDFLKFTADKKAGPVTPEATKEPGP